MVNQLYVGKVKKGPTERLDWTENWADILVPIEDSIIDLSCTVDTGLTIWSETFTDMDTTLWIDIGGVAGTRYTASFDITTASGRKFRRSILVNCVQR